MTQEGMLLAGVGLVTILAAAFAIVFFRLASRIDIEAIHTAWLEEFSVESYAPMERLLDDSDFEYVARELGRGSKAHNRLLAERRKIFGQYLGLMIRDFNKLHYLAKLMVVHSPEDRPELLRELLRQQVRFYYAVCVVRCKVLFYPLGWTPVDVPKLLNALQRMRSQIQPDAFAGAGATV